jgi:dTMP kinase
MGAETVAVLENFVHADLQPDMTLLFDLSLDEGMKRVAGRGEADRFEVESVKFFERVRSTYLERAANQPQRFRVIDASQGPEQVWQQVRNTLKAAPGL